jgi:hypothetical protein
MDIKELIALQREFEDLGLKQAYLALPFKRGKLGSIRFPIQNPR